MVVFDKINEGLLNCGFLRTNEVCRGKKRKLQSKYSVGLCKAWASAVEKKRSAINDMYAVIHESQMQTCWLS